VDCGRGAPFLSSNKTPSAYAARLPRRPSTQPVLALITPTKASANGGRGAQPIRPGHHAIAAHHFSKLIGGLTFNLGPSSYVAHTRDVFCRGVPVRMSPAGVGYRAFPTKASAKGGRDWTHTLSRPLLAEWEHDGRPMPVCWQRMVDCGGWAGARLDAPRRWSQPLMDDKVLSRLVHESAPFPLLVAHQW
jgi:hypothetical protein